MKQIVQGLVTVFLCGLLTAWGSPQAMTGSANPPAGQAAGVPADGPVPMPIPQPGMDMPGMMMPGMVMPAAAPSGTRAFSVASRVFLSEVMSGAASNAVLSDVSIANFAFSPDALNVPVGTKVVWTNNDETTHTVTADGGAFNSGPLSPGATFEFTFTQAGTYAYHCSIHSFMTGTVVVTAGGK